MAIPGLYKFYGRPPQSGCGWLIAAAVLTLIVGGALIALAFYVTNSVQGMFQNP